MIKRENQQNLPLEYRIKIFENQAKIQNNKLENWQKFSQWMTQTLPKKLLVCIDVTLDDEEVTFYLDNQKLSQLNILRQIHNFSQYYEIKIDQELIKKIQQNGFLPKLFKIGKQAKEKVFCAYGVAFITCYESELAPINRNQYSSKVIGTLISLDGDILNKICQDYLTEPSFYPRTQEIILAHHWLINQTLKSVRTQVADWLTIFLYGLTLIGTSYSIISSILVHQYLKQIIILLLSLLLPCFWKRIQPYLLRWIWQQLINPRSRFRKNIATRIIKLG